MEQRLTGILRDDILGTSEPLHATTDLFEAGLDSMGIMQLVLALEEHFGAVIEPSELSRDHFSTISRIADLIRSKQATS